VGQDHGWLVDAHVLCRMEGRRKQNYFSEVTETAVTQCSFN
jgi:hypothetical protein